MTDTNQPPHSQPNNHAKTEEHKATAEKYYSNDSFWHKLKKFANRLGTDALEKLLTLYYCFQDSDTPSKDKAIILSALGYFIMPFDAIPDILPGGWTDDLGLLALALSRVVRSIKDLHIQKAKEKLNKIVPNT